MQRTEDDSIHNFVQRRFGADIANNVVDPVVRGICGGKSARNRWVCEHLALRKVVIIGFPIFVQVTHGK